MEEEPEEAEVGGGRRFTDELKAVYGERRSEILYSKYSTVGGLRKRDGERATNERTDASANSAPALSLSLSLSAAAAGVDTRSRSPRRQRRLLERELSTTCSSSRGRGGLERTQDIAHFYGARCVR